MIKDANQIKNNYFMSLNALEMTSISGEFFNELKNINKDLSTKL